MILVTKSLYKLLVLLAQNNYFNEYGELGAEARALIWQNFITVVFATLLLAYCKNLYTLDDYDFMFQYKRHSTINKDEEYEEIPGIVEDRHGKEETQQRKNKDEEEEEKEENKREMKEEAVSAALSRVECE